MKKTLYSLLAILSVCFALVSCGDDDNNSGAKHSQPVSEAMAGVYTGVWHMEWVENDVPHVNVQDGTITVQTVEKVLEEGTVVEKNATMVVTDCPEIATAAGKTLCATAWVNDGAKFNATTVDSKTYPNQISGLNGQIDDDVITVRFMRSVKVGKKNTNYFFYFSGVKNPVNPAE